MIVSAPPRDNLTSIHRELADIAGAELGVEIKVENKPGSGGREGVEALIEAAPDGHTIAAVWNAPLTIAPHTGAASYTIDDIVPIMRTTAGAPLVVCVHPGFRADDSDDFVDHVEDNPGKYSYGTDGPGGIVELAGGRLFRPLGLDLKPVAFDGSAGVLRGFLGRKSDIYIGGVAGIIGQTKEGYAKCLFSTSEDPPMRLSGLGYARRPGSGGSGDARVVGTGRAQGNAARKDRGAGRRIPKSCRRGSVQVFHEAAV